MVIVSKVLHAEFRRIGHREDAPHFNHRHEYCSTYFFREKHTNRRLKWIYNHSHADLRTCATQKMYVLKVTTFQLGILNSFNEADQLTLSEIRRETALDNKGDLFPVT